VSIVTAIAIYFILWWMVLFAVLPWGVRSQQEAGDVTHGSDPGAPSVPRLGRKLVWTTLVSGVLFAGCVVVYDYRELWFDALVALVGATR
jgi:predicted secreted protein